MEKTKNDRLRSEASELKDCFTSFSFQSIAFSAGVLTFTFQSMKGFPAIALSVLPVIVLLMVVCKIGIHKYTTCNRIYGYQLYLEQTRKLSLELRTKIAEVGWEEALIAWRIVQPVIFQKLYSSPETDWIASNLRQIPLLNMISGIRPDLFQIKKDAREVIVRFKEKKESTEKDTEVSIQDCILEYPWFMPEKLTQLSSSQVSKLFPSINGSKQSNLLTYSYHAGTYLKDMLRILIIMQHLLLIPLLLVVTETIDTVIEQDSRLFQLELVSLVGMLIFINLRAYQLRRRRVMLENELLSIHSCAITWHLVLLAHIRSTLDSQAMFYCGYIENLISSSQEIIQNIFSAEQWIQSQYSLLGNEFKAMEQKIE
jgi:hypothetical protein